MNNITRRDLDKVWEVVDELKEVLGSEELLEALVRALDIDELNASLDYIIRVYDLSEYLEESED